MGIVHEPREIEYRDHDWEREEQWLAERSADHCNASSGESRIQHWFYNVVFIAIGIFAVTVCKVVEGFDAVKKVFSRR